ncbi:hypothetical protein AV656_05180 [Bhargavaea cecembensis]|uniref:Lipoprotein n=1 Tax=Bhargavaea cecembensis TaxID=394098 RepID=A0A161RER7_9BACL|nr:hypothetical protein [Bhargavaea cecembensis]KZE38312.1 hypothetical protein AV656_05180 [Bhargavaea cecembensis]
MQLKWKHLSLSAAAVLMLAACGTAEEEADNNQDTQMEQEETADQNQGSETDEGTEKEASDENAPDEEDTEVSEQEEARGPERELTYQSGTSQQTSQAKLTKSDEMDYSIYVLDGYQLTSEEPNKDVLYWNEDEQVFMRIETFGSDADYTMLTEQMVGSLEFDGGEAADVSGEYSLAESDGIEELVIRQLETEEGVTTGAVFMKDGMTVRLTVFDKPEAGQTDALLSMGATIGQK